MRRLLPALFFAALLLPLSARGSPRRRVMVPIEEYLPLATVAFLSLPAARDALVILERTGEDLPAFAGRIAGLLADPDESEPAVREAIREFALSADGPLTFSLHPGETETAFLITATTRSVGEHLEVAASNLIRDVIAPALNAKPAMVNIRGVRAVRIATSSGYLHFVTTRGFFLVSTSAGLLDSVLGQMASPGLETFANGAAYRKLIEGLSPLPDRYGLLYASHPDLLPLGGVLGGRSAGGLLVPQEDGFTDQVTVTAGPDLLLGRLRADGPVPAAWFGAEGRGAWLGASLDPAGAQQVVLGLLGGGWAPQATGLEPILAGPVEAILPPGGEPLLRLHLKEGADADGLLGPLAAVARVEGRLLLLSAGADLLLNAPPGEFDAAEEEGGAVLRAPFSALFADGTLGGATQWLFEVISREDAGSVIRIGCDQDRLGPFQAMVATLLR